MQGVLLKKNAYTAHCITQGPPYPEAFLSCTARPQSLATQLHAGLTCKSLKALTGSKQYHCNLSHNFITTSGFPNFNPSFNKVWLLTKIVSSSKRKIDTYNTRCT